MTSNHGCCGCCSRRAVIIAFAVTGVCLLATGLAFRLSDVFNEIIKEKVDQKVALKPGGLVYNEWVHTTIPVYMQYFVFHLVNPEDVFAGTAIPTVKQMGPYSYREIRSNEVLNWSSSDSIVTFMPNRSYIFDPETSCAGCDDKKDTFVTVNIPLLTVALWLRNTNYNKKHQLCFLGLEVEANAKKVKLFQRKSVYDILWGYTDPFLEFLIKASKSPPPFNCPGREGMTDFVQLQYNNTYYGISAINTGQTDISKLEQYTMWREESIRLKKKENEGDGIQTVYLVNQNLEVTVKHFPTLAACHLSWWSDKYANMINGTDGTQFSPGVSKKDVLYAFSPEVCRSFYFVYESDVTVRDIKLYRFIGPDELYLSGDVYAPNKGFCVPPGCLPTGLLNISRCQPQNPPVAVSPPHFYQGNKTLVEAVNGLHPTKSAHETYVDIEPITGIVMRVAKRIQINVALEPVDILAQTRGKFEPVFLPVMYANESALISEEKAAEFRHQVYLPITLIKVVEYLLIALGALFILVAFVLLLLACRKTKGRIEMCVINETDGDDERRPLMNDGNKVHT